MRKERLDAITDGCVSNNCDVVGIGNKNTRTDNGKYSKDFTTNFSLRWKFCYNSHLMVESSSYFRSYRKNKSKCGLDKLFFAVCHIVNSISNRTVK